MISGLHPGFALRWFKAGTPVVWTVLVLTFCPALADSETLPTSFDAANKLYGEGKFADAAAGYQKLLQTGTVSEAVFFNLGNAFFKSGQIGRAIAAYRKAEELAPRDPDLRANLQFARNQIQGPTHPPDRLERWLAKLTLNEWTWSAAGAIWLWFVLVTAVQLRPSLKLALRRYTLGLGAVACALTWCFGAALHQNRFVRRAIIITQEAAVRQAPLEESQNAFTVRDGAELQILDRKEDWLQVSADPRRIGWVRLNQVLVAPSI